MATKHKASSDGGSVKRQRKVITLMEKTDSLDKVREKVSRQLPGNVVMSNVPVNS